MKLLLKWPNLYYSTTRVRAEVLPGGHRRLREHARRRQDHLRGLLPDRARARPHLRRAARTSRSATTCGRSSCARTRSGSSSSRTGRSVTGNAAFDAALAAGGVIDTIGRRARSPARRCSSSTTSSASRRRTPRPSRAKAGSRCPRATCSRSRPGWDADELDDPVEILVAEHGPPRHPQGDRRRSRTSRAPRAVREHPDRFFAAIGVDPNEGMEAVRKIEQYAVRVRPEVRRRVPAPG